VNYVFKDIVFSKEEFETLRQCIGEYRRIVRDQTHNNSEYALHKLEIANNIIAIIDRVEWLNNNTK